MKNKPKIVLLDGNAIIHRAYHGLPPLTTKDGATVHAVYGFALTLFSVLEKFHPEHIAASFDLAGGTFRDDLYEHYKATRVAAPDDLYEQIPIVKKLVEALNIPIYECQNYEADDCVGTLAKQAEKKGLETIIVTGDSDTLQLVTKDTRVFTMRRGIKDTVLYDVAGVKEKYGFTPEQLIEYKGLAGDSSDNIPGVSGVGAKTATDLIQKYQNLEGIYAHLDELAGKLKERLEKDKEQAFLSRELGTIDTKVPVTLSLTDTETKNYDTQTAEAFLKHYEFYSLLKRLMALDGKVSKAEQEKTTKPKARQKMLKTKAEIADTHVLETPGTYACVLHKEASSLFGQGIQSVEIFSAEPGNIHIEWNDETADSLREFFENEKLQKVFYDAKDAMRALAKEKIALAGIAFDVSIAAYLCQAAGEKTLESLATHLAVNGKTEAETLFLCSEKLSLLLAQIAKEQKKAKNVETVFRDIELPLISVLFAMEERGIILNKKTFKKMSDDMGASIEKCADEIYALAGKEFNINSPKQLAEVLFEDLQIPSEGIKKTKTGISTSSSELQKLSEYPIAAKIEDYRELFKLKSTYLDPLPELTDEASRLHTTYSQTIAATGRLSSINPNLQNIPIRGNWGEKLRVAFEASPGYQLVSADYSQIELRIMAHVSQDQALLKAFQNSEDVHATTAAAVYKVPIKEVTKEMRRQAKVFNFGIMYGMGAFGLSQAADIKQSEAKEFIDIYFKKFKGVKKYLDTIIKETKKSGYQETELGRRRLIPEIQSHNIQVQRSGERMAVNMPIQGLEADIVKLAMLAADRLADRYQEGEVYQLLQVHDEIIFEVKSGLAEAFAKELKKTMESAYSIDVPLTVDVAIGKNWGEV